MEELIRITEKNGNKVVSSRDLYEFLEVETPFRKWIERMFAYGFEENIDYTRADKNVRQVSGTKYLKEYALTLDCAKEISMLQRNDKGKKARRYFIEVEKKARSENSIDFSDPNTVYKLAQNWAEEHKRRKAAENKLKILTPKAQLMDRVLDTDEKIDIGQAAKILELPFGRNTMFKKLRQNGIFFKNRNEPRQEYIKRKYFVLKEKYISRNTHDGFVVVKVLVTQKGLEFLSGVFSASTSQKEMALIR